MVTITGKGDKPKTYPTYPRNHNQKMPMCWYTCSREFSVLKLKHLVASCTITPQPKVYVFSKDDFSLVYCVVVFSWCFLFYVCVALFLLILRSPDQAPLWRESQRLVKVVAEPIEWWDDINELDQKRQMSNVNQTLGWHSKKSWFVYRDPYIGLLIIPI